MFLLQLQFTKQATGDTIDEQILQILDVLKVNFTWSAEKQEISDKFPSSAVQA